MKGWTKKRDFFSGHNVTWEINNEKGNAGEKFFEHEREIYVETHLSNTIAYVLKVSRYVPSIMLYSWIST